MIRSIKTMTTVKEEGKIEIESNELHAGEAVEVIILKLHDEDTTTYLLSSDANKKHLRESLLDINNRDSYIYVDPEEK